VSAIAVRVSSTVRTALSMYEEMWSVTLGLTSRERATAMSSSTERRPSEKVVCA